MDMCMIDVTDVPDVKAGDEVLVYGPGQAERAAQTMGTIVYELLCDLTGRGPPGLCGRARGIKASIHPRPCA